MSHHRGSWLTVLLLVAVLGFDLAPASAQTPTLVGECRVINRSGSFLVTRNLPGPGGLVGGDCLRIRSNFVTIDLNGFTLRGNRNGNGITDQGKRRRGVTVRNGTITNFRNGIDLDSTSESVIRDIQAIDNRGDGIRAGESCIISDNVAGRNGGDGIFADDGDCIVTDNAANSNDEDGMQLNGTGHVVSGNTASGNDDDGIQVDCPSSLSGNVALENDSVNIRTLRGRCVQSKNLAP